MIPKKHVYYLPLSSADLHEAVSIVERKVRRSQLEYDSIACRGVSGLIVAAPLAYNLDKPLIVVRKGERTHSGYAAEIGADTRTYIIVDDLIDMGGTMDAIIKALYPARCVGIFLYDSTREEAYEGVPVCSNI